MRHWTEAFPDIRAGACKTRLLMLAAGLALSGLASLAQPVFGSSLADAEWSPRAPRRDTVIDVETKFGLFRFPIGYDNYPYLLPDAEIASPIPGTRRYRVNAIVFHFTMPDGHQNAALAYFRPGDDGGDRIGVDPSRYVVWITDMEAPQERSQGDLLAMASKMPPDQFHVTLSGPTSSLHWSWYDGWAQAPSTQERILIRMVCDPAGSAGSCFGHMYFETQKLSLQFLFQVERRDHVFEIGNVISSLLKQWRIQN